MIIALSIVLAVYLVSSGVLERLFSISQELNYIAAFITGIFFTSVLTMAVAAVSFVKIAPTMPPFILALYGALGAVIGDAIIFFFVKDALAEDVMELIKASGFRRYLSIFRLRLFRWLLPLLGALILASPISDELGLALMGLSKVRPWVVLSFAFVLNFIGIFAIAVAVRGF